MAEAQLQPSITKEQDILALSLSPTAPNTAHISVGAQQQTILLPPTLNSVKSMTEWRTSVHNDRMTPTKASSTQPTITQGAIAARSNSEIPIEPPDMPIPPKLLDPKDATTYSNIGATLEDTLNMPRDGNTKKNEFLFYVLSQVPVFSIGAKTRTRLISSSAIFLQTVHLP